MKQYLKWVFSRWWFWIIGFFIFLVNFAPNIQSFTFRETGFYFGLFAGSLIIPFIITTIIYFVNKRKKK